MEEETPRLVERTAASWGARDEALFSLCEDVKIIGNMLMDVSHRTEAVEHKLESMDTKTNESARTRSAWSQR